MSESVIQQEIANELSKLKVEEQQQVLEYARPLAEAKPVGVHGETLLAFAGTIEKSDLEIMRRGIDEDCERTLNIKRNP